MVSSWIRRRFGRKQGLLRAARSWTQWRAGRLADEENVPWARVQRLVFVCHGNVCRSPYGEAKARVLGWETASCGLFAKPGHPAEAAALAAAVRRGASLASHRATSFDAFDWRPGDLLLCFEIGHAEECRRRLGDHTDIFVTLVGLYVRPRRPHIEDPFGLPDEYFDSCYELIEEALDRIGRLRDAAREDSR